MITNSDRAGLKLLGQVRIQDRGPRPYRSCRLAGRTGFALLTCRRRRTIAEHD